MKNKHLFSLLFIVLTFSFCSKKAENLPPATASGMLKVKVSDPNIFANGFDETSITVLDKNGNDVSTQAIIKINGTVISGLKYSTNTPGTIQVTASLGTEVAESANIVAANPGASKYSSKVLAEKYTASWCGFCPRVSYKIKQTATANTKVIPVYIHDGDALNFPLVSQLKTQFNISAVPGVIINRTTSWSDNQNDWNETVPNTATLTTVWAPLGQSIQSSVNGTVISGKVFTEFNVSTSRPMKIMVMLVEDGIITTQSNYYNATAGSPLNGLGQPISNYTQQNVLRQMATDINGDAIPSSATIKNNIFEKSFSFNASGYNISKCYIVSTVLYDNGSSWQGTINSQIVKAGLTQNFD